MKIISAIEAKGQAEAAQENCVEKAIGFIDMASKDGFQEVMLFNVWLSMEGVKKIMDLGYSVTTVIHPFEQRKVYKISW